MVMVPAPSVQPIGLAIHELAANAAVHGSLSRRGGTLTIGWKQAGEGVVFEWLEHGGADGHAKSAKGFGNVLLGAVIEKQLGGTIPREWRGDGLRLVVELPSLNRVGGTLKSSP